MKRIVYQFPRRGSVLTAVVIALGFVAHVDGSPQRRGQMYRPQQPAIIASPEMIDGLNKALRALGATDRDYDGHREKAINHINAAIHNLELPNARGQSDAAADKALAGKPPATKGATTPEAASETSVRKALATLFSVHHDLTDHAATRGRLRADAEVRIAIQELGLALKTTKPAPAPASAPTRPAGK
jgi:hypothetical protein